MLDSDLEVGGAAIAIGYQLATRFTLGPRINDEAALNDYKIYRKSSPSLTRALPPRDRPPLVTLVDGELVAPSWSRYACGPHRRAA